MVEQLHWKDIGGPISEKKDLVILLRKKRAEGKELTINEQDKLASYFLALKNTEELSRDENDFLLEVRARQTREDREAEAAQLRR